MRFIRVIEMKTILKSWFFRKNLALKMTKNSFKFQPTDPDLVVEKNVYMYRAYLALKKFGVVRDEVGNNSPALLQPLKTLMAYIQSEGNASKRWVVIFVKKLSRMLLNTSISNLSTYFSKIRETGMLRISVSNAKIGKSLTDSCKFDKNL